MHKIVCMDGWIEKRRGFVYEWILRADRMWPSAPLVAEWKIQKQLQLEMDAR